MSDENDDDSSKTEDPSARKLEDARQKGQVAISREVNTWVMLVAGTLIIGAMTNDMFYTLTDQMQMYLAQADQLPGGTGGISAVLSHAFLATMATIFLPLLLMMAAAMFGPFVQVGPLWAPERIKFDAQKISPIKGWERLFSKTSLIEFVKGLVKIGVVSVVTYFVLKPYLPGAEHLVGLPFAALLAELLALTIQVMVASLFVLMIFAAVDLTYQKYDLYQRLRMTKQEVKDEYRQTEGDPVVRGRLKQLRLEKARQRMMQNVPKADVVITNPTHFAVALQYNPDEMMAPKLLAKGADEIARRIRETATEHGIEIVQNPPLARAIFDTVEIDQMIPQEMYRAVAEVITYVFKKTGKMKVPK